MCTIERHIAAPSSTVIATIKAAVASANRAEIPPDLREAGIVGLTGRADDRRFKIWFNRRWVSGEVDTLDLRGEIVPVTPDHTIVRASATRDRAPVLSVLLFVGIAGVIALLGGSGSWVMVVFAAAIGAFSLLKRVGDPPDDPEIAHLIAWIEHALDDFRTLTSDVVDGPDVSDERQSSNHQLHS